VLQRLWFANYFIRVPRHPGVTAYKMISTSIIPIRT